MANFFEKSIGEMTENELEEELKKIQSERASRTVVKRKATIQRKVKKETDSILNTQKQRDALKVALDEMKKMIAAEKAKKELEK